MSWTEQFYFSDHFCEHNVLDHSDTIYIQTKELKMHNCV